MIMWATKQGKLEAMKLDSREPVGENNSLGSGLNWPTLDSEPQPTLEISSQAASPAMFLPSENSLTC